MTAPSLGNIVNNKENGKGAHYVVFVCHFKSCWFLRVCCTQNNPAHFVLAISRAVVCQSMSGTEYPYTPTVTQKHPKPSQLDDYISCWYLLFSIVNTFYITVNKHPPDSDEWGEFNKTVLQW